MIFLIIAGCAYRSAMNDGKKLFEAGQYDDAIRYFEIALRKKPESADAKIWLKKTKEKAAETHYQKGAKAEENKEWTRASAEYSRVLSLIPDYRDAKKRLETVESAEALEHYQKGVALKEARKWDQALKEFEEALLWAENFKDTHKKIQETKESAAEEHYQQAVHLIEDGKYEQALTALKDCWSYVPEYKDSLKQEEKAKLALADIEYKKAEELVEQQKWFDALDKFQKADSWVNGYQDVSSRIAFVKEKIAEDYYNKAIQVLEEAKQGRSVKPYREALNYLEQSFSYVSNFRDARQKYDEAKEGATIRVAIMPIQAVEERAKDAAAQLTQTLFSELLRRKTELMAFVDREYVARFLLEDKDLTNLAEIDASSAIKIGELAGVHAFVVGQVILTSTSKEAEAETKTSSYTTKEEYVDSKGNTRTRRVQNDFQYQLWRKSREVKLQVNYQIISGIDGTVVDASTVSGSKKDEARWATIPQMTSEVVGAEIPKPSYYGDFLVADGKLVELKENNISKVGSMFQAVWGIQTLSGLNITDNKAYFIIYRQLPPGVIEMVKLTKLKYAKQMQFEAPLVQPQTADVNMWVAEQEKEVKLRIAPVQGDSDMSRLIPATPLSPGVYALHTGNLYSTGQFPGSFEVNDFTVKTGVDAQTLLQYAQNAERGSLTPTREPKSQEMLLNDAVDTISYKLTATIVDNAEALVK